MYAVIGTIKGVIEYSTLHKNEDEANHIKDSVACDIELGFDSVSVVKLSNGIRKHYPFLLVECSEGKAIKTRGYKSVLKASADLLNIYDREVAKNTARKIFVDDLELIDISEDEYDPKINYSSADMIQAVYDEVSWSVDLVFTDEMVSMKAAS